MKTTMVRLVALIKKELQAILGDKQSLRLLIMPVILQLLLFPFAATLEVKNNAIAIFDEDGGPIAEEIFEELGHTPAFERIVRLSSEKQMRDVIDKQEALLVLRLGPHLSKRVKLGQPTSIQAIIDGRRSNSGQIALSYVQNIIERAQSYRLPRKGADFITIRHFYNPNLDYFRFILPSLVAMITTLSALIVTALSVAREREQGTLDQLLVSPLLPWMIFVGKATPALLVAMIQASIILAGSIFGYGVQFRGSMPLLYACMIPYVLALVGIGLFISALCATQQQAFLGVFLFVMPGILLSGYVSPISNMPQLLQILTWANPIRHFIVIAKGIYLKASVFGDFSQNILALLITAFVTGSLSLALFQRRFS